MDPVAAAAAAAAGGLGGGGGALVVEELEWKAGGFVGGGVEDAAGGGGVAAASQQQQQQQQQPPQRGVKRSSGGGGPVTASTSEAAAAGTTTTNTCTEPAGTRVSKRSRRERPATAKERISKIPPSAVGKRSSIYRGVTRHRWTGRYEAHLWDKSTWNQAQNKKGKQVYLGAYDEEEAAARAYDLAALKYWGPGTVINFPVSDYARDVEEMQSVSREEYLASLRRKSSGFSRGVSKYRGVARHHHNGRWEARIGRVFGNKYLYLGTYGTQEEAAAAYDMAAIEYRGLNAVTNFDLSRYIKWLRPPGGSGASGAAGAAAEGPGGDGVDELMNCKAAPAPGGELLQQQAGVSPEQHPSETADESAAVHMWPGQASEPYQFPSLGLSNAGTQSSQRAGTGAGLGAGAAPTALGLLWQSNMFKQMLEKASAHSTPDSDSQHEHEHDGGEPDPDDVLAMSMFPPSGLGMVGMVGMDDDPALVSYEEGHSGDAVYHDMPPFPSSCFAADGQELDSGAPFWNSLPMGGPAGAVLPMRSPITV